MRDKGVREETKESRDRESARRNRDGEIQEEQEIE